jgi:hypothetical protein
VARLTRSIANQLTPAVFAMAIICLARSGLAQSLDGCMGPPSKATSVSKPTVVFVWPCYVLGDTFLAPDPREVERDRQLRAQLGRLRDLVSGSGFQILEASGALNLRFVSPSGVIKNVRTTNGEWRGVLIHCPGQSIKKLKVPGAPPPDAAILGPVEGCGHGSVQPK